MIRIVPIPETGYKAVWDTVTDTFLQDACGCQGWSSVDEIDLSHYDEWTRLELLERISLLWDNA